MMKLISVIVVVMTLGFMVAAATFSKPMLHRQGTAVIYAVDEDGRNGGASTTVKLPDSMSDKQLHLLNFAYSVAKEDGVKKPQYLQGILMQESDGCVGTGYRVAGLSNRPGDRYFGCGQIKLQTAKGVMSRFPELWKYLQTRTEEELQAMLILDDKFNIRVASKLLLLNGVNIDAAAAITAYNLGIGGAKTVDPAEHPYTKSVQSKIKNVLIDHPKIQLQGNQKLALNEYTP